MGDPRDAHGASNTLTTAVERAAATPAVAEIRPHAGTDELEVGAMVGRYVVLDTLGRGGMGFVVRAYDPKLCREVALKRVLPRALTDAGGARLIREAQAMAQLSHSNVVAVHDVEVDKHGVTLVMEYVRGETLRSWTRGGKRSPREIFDAFAQAGRGLAAAHRAGVVHRDFKPSNVLIGSDGSVKVTDFGLARPIDASLDSSILPADASSAGISGADVSSRSAGDASPSSRGSHDEWDAALTRPDEVVGTPGYMAPEQHVGAAAGAAADQFAFCVALWEALCGAPPYDGSSVRALYKAKRAGPPEWPRQVALPRASILGLRRGLDPDPERRHATMDALLRTLQLDPTSRRRRVAVGAASLAAVALGGIGIYGWVSARRQLCTGGEERLAQVWNETARERVRSGLQRHPASYATDTATRAEALLDAYGRGWSTHYGEACEATSVRGEQSASILDLRMACLERAKAELGSSVELLADADPKLVEKALDFVQGLPLLERCADIDALRAEVPPPDDAETAAEVESVRKRLAEARSLVRAARYDRAEPLARELDAAATALAYRPLTAEVAGVLGDVLDDVGKYADAETAMRRALDEALVAGSRRSAIDAANALALLLARHAERPAEARVYGEVALGLVRNLQPDSAFEGAVRNSIAAVWLTEGKYAEAEAEFRRGLELTEAELGSDRLDVASARGNLATALHGLGRHAEAEREFTTALAIRESVQGPEHPATARARGNLANILMAQGRTQAAADLLRRLVDEQARVLGAEHPSVPQFRYNLSSALQDLGKYDEAVTEARLAIESFERTLGPDHPRLGEVRTNLGNTLNLMGRYDQAVTEYRRALELFAPMGAEHPHNVHVRLGLGGALAQLGREDEAEAALREALGLAEKVWPAEHPMIAEVSIGLGELLLRRGRPHEAVALLERAWAIHRAGEAPAIQRGGAAFSLAKALWDHGDRGHARELAEQARSIHAQSSADGDAVRAVEEWLRTHRA